MSVDSLPSEVKVVFKKPLTGSYLEAMNDVIVAAEQKDDQGLGNGGKV